MRRANDLLARLLLTLALMVAAWPARVSAVVVAQSKCAMPCCAAKPMRACVALAAKVVCGCEVKAAPQSARAVQPGVVSSLDLQPFASRTAPSVVIVAENVVVEPGLVGLDVGPPPDPPHRDDASRAPPVVRA